MEICLIGKAIKAKNYSLQALENLRLKCTNIYENGPFQFDKKRSNNKTGLENKSEGVQKDNNLGNLPAYDGTKAEKYRHEESGAIENSTVKKNFTGTAVNDIKGSGYEISGNQESNVKSRPDEMSRGFENETLKEKIQSLNNSSKEGEDNQVSGLFSHDKKENSNEKNKSGSTADDVKGSGDEDKNSSDIESINMSGSGERSKGANNDAF